MDPLVNHVIPILTLPKKSWKIERVYLIHTLFPCNDNTELNFEIPNYTTFASLVCVCTSVCVRDCVCVYVCGDGVCGDCELAEFWNTGLKMTYFYRKNT